ncbi:VOC family protein [Alterisphingorhabdus coralli]|uniref:VOC family protein n=1 Tax=Alterisphingorhabdus coralli TaxID=3071408 RepID=A0AA97F6N2_9SPHN|nr:VOC family protein [Parasphingorhabdus sp. SCSIO 66989]WOE75389.1 VOC family protein [Parasphingorhabdus sp. SCSIO 66989]
MSDRPQHGQIIGGLSVVPDLEAAIRDYRDVLGLELRQSGALDEALALSWGCPQSAGRPMAVLGPASGADCTFRLVEQADHPDFRPTTSFGWAAYELTVQQVFGWPERLNGSGFDIVGPPKELEGMPFFVPMQVLGLGREMLYLNEVRENMPSCDLPKAQSLVDHIFICILATPDREAAVQWYVNKLGLEAADTHNLAYSMINKAFDLPEDFRTDLTMVLKGRMTILEVDDYPPQATARPRHDGMLPPGNALVTLAVDSLDYLNLDWITPPAAYDAMPCNGRRAATVVGLSGELLELVEFS